MELRVGDIVSPRYKLAPANPMSTPHYYRIVSLRQGSFNVPNIILRVDSEGSPISESQVKDLCNDWHNYTWTLYKAEKIIPLTEADKKYEKIILKIRKLDEKFQTRKELK